MTARKTTTVVEEAAPEDDSLVSYIDDGEEDQALDQLEGMISEFSGSADCVVNVYRQGDGKNLSFLFRTNPDEMTGGEIMERCRDNYGTGDFRIHIRKGPRLVANKPFSVEAKKEDEKEQYQPQNNNAEMLAFITAQMNNQQAMFATTMQAMAEAMKGRETPAIDPIAMQSGMIQALVALKGLAAPETGNQKDPVEMLVQGITLARELGPRDGETNTSDILLEALKTFGGPLANAAAQMKPPGAPGNGALLTGPGDPQAAADAEKEKQMGVKALMLKGQLAWLIKQAESGKNPELYAELLLDQLGEVVVLDFISKPDALDKLAAVNPGVVGQRLWFEKLRDAILALTDSDDAGDSEGEDGEYIPAGNVIIPGADPDAVRSAAIDGDATGDPVGGDGDTPDA